MAWDKTIPQGSTALNISDNALRENNTSLEDALDLEHDFTTGGTQTGTHHFGVGDDTARGAAYPAPVDGNLWINDKDYATYGWLVLQIYYGAIPAWKDVFLYTSVGAYTTVPNVWASGQAGTYAAVTESGSGPYDWDWDGDTSQYFKGTLQASNDTEIQAPTGTLFAANNAASWTFQVTQNAVTAGTLSLDPTYFTPAYGAQPDISTTLGSINLVVVTMLSNQTFIYTVVPAA